ncbi:MAG TPA: STAS/SEC14 domain-containing protein [Puia sp.]|jgi:hypothetical protein
MIGVLPGLAPNVIGFRASGEVTREDYENVVFPEVKRYTQDGKDLNLVFYVETSPKNFSIGAWIRNMWLGLKEFTLWHRVAIISDLEKVRHFTDAISRLLPGEYKGFSPNQLDAAVRWAGTEEEPAVPDVPPHVEVLLPSQIKGAATMTSATVLAANEKDARFIFKRTGERLLDVNQWSEYCTSMASFLLIDEDGGPLQGRASVGDFIRIDIPGPGTREGEGYDWVQVEKIEYASMDNIFFMEVRPSRNPCNKGSTAIAHFLESSATSTFMVVCEEKTVSVTVYGRNEVPNTAVPGTLDKWRNSAVGSVGSIGLSKIQWKALVKGLLEKE